MIIGTAEFTLHADWIHSLKEKRMLAKSIIAKIRNKYNISVAEIEEQDRHQTLVLGMAWVAGSVRQSDSVFEQLNRFLESVSEAEVQEVRHEIR